MTNRRFFLRQAAALALASGWGTSTLSAFQLQSLSKTPDPADEDYWKQVRLAFPLNRNHIYLNNGTMGPSPYPVIEAVQQTMLEVDTNGSYGGWEGTAGKIAAFVGAQSTEIALTHNVTDGINIACWGLPLKKGDEIILTTHEHAGNAVPWLSRAKRDGLIIKTFSPGATAAATIANLEQVMTKKTRVFAFPHIPCTQGQIFPMKEICALAKTKGIFTFVDGAHGPGMLQLDLRDMGCDMYASCCHKWMLGPKGTGFIYVREGFQETLQPFTSGAGSDAGWDMLAPVPYIKAYAKDAHKYYFGTQNLALYKGVDAAIDFINQIGMQNIEARSRYLAGWFQAELMNRLPGKIDMLTPVEPQSRGAVIGFRVKGIDFNEVSNKAGEQKIRIRAVAENGLNSSRVSTHIYNSKNELEQLLDLLQKLAV